MLSSPGHSPRQFSSPSPSLHEKSIQNPNRTPNSQITPQNPRKRSNTVLDEDTDVAAIEKIIERDFFPDIPKLRDRLDWLEAVRTSDPVLIRDAQLKILERRSGKAAGSDTGACCWGTPVMMVDRHGDKSKKYDLDDLRKTPNPFYVESAKKADNGYSFVKTPSPAPGVDESPFITWGEIEGTPLRLESEDTPIDIGGSGDGPQFKIPLPPSRDVKSHSLSRDAARKIRERSKMFQKPPLHSSARGGSASPSARTLSPAAQKFVRNAMAKSSHSGNVDESLHASYRGASPGAITPKAGRSVSRLGRDGSLSSRSPSVREGSPW